MLAIIFIAGIIILLMIALLVAYLDLRSTVEIMKNTINWLDCRVIELNKQLYSKLYSDKEDDNNERE